MFEGLALVELRLVALGQLRHILQAFSSLNQQSYLFFVKKGGLLSVGHENTIYDISTLFYLANYI